MGQSFPPEDVFMGRGKISSVAPSWEPAYGMKIRLNFTASVSVPSRGVRAAGDGEKRLEVLARFQGQFHFVFYYENLSSETVRVFGVIRLDLFHRPWQFTLGFFWRGWGFLFSFVLCLLELMLHFLPFRKKNVCGLWCWMIYYCGNLRIVHSWLWWMWDISSDPWASVRLSF